MHPLAAEGYIDEATTALGQDNVFVSSEVGGGSALADALQQQIGDASIGIAVFSDNASFEASGTEIVQALAGAHPEYSTIIVAVGDDLAAGSRVLDSGEALRIANEAESSADSVDSALTEPIQTVIAETPAGGAAGGGAAGGGVDGGAVVGIALAVAAVLAGVGVTIGLIGRTRKTRSRADDRPQVPERIAAHVATLQALSVRYAALAASGDQVAAQTRTDIDDITANTVELFARLDRKSAEGQHSMAAVEYDDKLRKLTGALNRDYLLDILTHPNLWDDPEDRVREVRSSVTAVSEELVENIKQVNARRGLLFQVSLDGLIGKRKELQEWERDFDNASGGDGSPAPRGD